MANGKDRTPNFKLILPRFDQATWHDDYYNNMRAIDGIISRFFGIANYVGVWQNSTLYSVGDRVLDTEQALIYEVQIEHTTSPEPTTFSEYRTSNPTYYEVFTTEVAFRGEWEADTDYAAGDFVTYTPTSGGSNEFAVASTAHTSGSDYPSDRDNGLWTVLLQTADVGDQELAAISNLTTFGHLVRTADNTYATRTITKDGDGLAVDDGDGVSDDPTIKLANDLLALEALATNGIAARTGTDTWAIRTITGTTGQVSVSNGGGVGGNPTISLPSSITKSLTFTAAIAFSGNVTVSGDLDHNANTATKIAVGTTGQRPGTPVKGDVRFNDTNSQYEGYDGSQWGPLGGAGLYKGENGETGDTVNGAGDIFRVNEQTLNTDVTIESGENASCAGPLTVASGVTLTVNGNLTVV